MSPIGVLYSSYIRMFDIEEKIWEKIKEIEEKYGVDIEDCWHDFYAVRDVKGERQVFSSDSPWGLEEEIIKS